MSKDTLYYFLVKDPKVARFYSLPKIHKRLHDVPRRPVILNCGYYTENICDLLREKGPTTVKRRFKTF